MFSGVKAHVVERISAAPVLASPFPHCVVDEVFPEEFYEEILDHWPAADRFVSGVETGRVTKGYSEERKILNFDKTHLSRLEASQRVFWAEAVLPLVRSPGVSRAILAKFRREIAERLADGREVFSTDALIVSDRTAYALGPHSDSPQKLVSLLFYLPEDATFKRYGTSLYVPRDPTFSCAEGWHYDEKHFTRISTVEFIPNRLLLFPRTDRSFHGVERVDVPGIERRLLISSIRAM